MDNIFTSAPQVASFNEGQEIISYQPAKAISWAKLVKDRHVRIVTFYGQIGWSDGYMLEVGEVPERLSKIKDFIESRRDDPINADNLDPHITADAPIVEPLATILGNGFHKEGVFMGNRPDIVYLSNLRSYYPRSGEALAETTIDKKYVDYFVKRYPEPRGIHWLKFLMKAKSQPVTVTWKSGIDEPRRIVGLIMPIFVDTALIERCRNFIQPGEPPYEPPVQPPPGERPLMSVLEGQYSIKQLREMARDANLSPTGDKRRLIKELQRVGIL